jgi:hypothetical protein
MMARRGPMGIRISGRGRRICPLRHGRAWVQPGTWVTLWTGHMGNTTRWIVTISRSSKRDASPRFLVRLKGPFPRPGLTSQGFCGQPRSRRPDGHRRRRREASLTAAGPRTTLAGNRAAPNLPQARRPAEPQRLQRAASIRHDRQIKAAEPHRPIAVVAPRQTNRFAAQRRRQVNRPIAPDDMAITHHLPHVMIRRLAPGRTHLRIAPLRGGIEPRRASLSQRLVRPVSVATRNDVRADAQSRLVSHAHWLRLQRASDARYLRFNAQSLRRMRDRATRRTIIETE